MQRTTHLLSFALGLCGVACSPEHATDPALDSDTLALTAAAFLHVYRPDPFSSATIDYISAGEVDADGAVLHSYVEYRLDLTPTQTPLLGCPVPCTAEEYERQQEMSMYPPLALGLFATNHYLASGRRNVFTAYQGEVLCTNPAWGRDGDELPMEVGGELSFDSSDSDSRIFGCDEPGAGPVEATLTLYQYAVE